jgi:hypothetical protein
MTETQEQRIYGVTGVCDACESLKHYYWNRVLKKRETTKAMKEGIQFHQLVLEPEKFYASHCTDQDLPEGKIILTTVDDIKSFAADLGVSIKGRKEQLITWAASEIAARKLDNVIIYDQWLETNTRDKEFISKAGWDSLHHMRDSVLSHKFTRKYLEFGHKEVEVEGELDGHKLRGRLDWFIDDPSLPYVIVVDLKKCVSAKFFKFRQVIYDKWYFVQAALYSHMIQEKYGRPCLFVWMATEGGAPYIAEAYSANEAMLEAGISHAKAALKNLEIAFETNHWSGYSDGMVKNIDIPNYGYDRAAELEDVEEDEI